MPASELRLAPSQSMPASAGAADPETSIGGGLRDSLLLWAGLAVKCFILDYISSGLSRLRSESTSVLGQQLWFDMGKIWQMRDGPVYPPGGGMGGATEGAWPWYF